MTAKEAVDQIAYKKPQHIKDEILLALENQFVADSDDVTGKLKSIDDGIFRVYYEDVLIYDSSVNPPVII